MCKKDIEKIKGEYNIERYGDYIVMYGYDFCAFDLEGNLLFHKKKYRGAGKFIPISEKCILLDCWGIRAYIAVSLENGAEFWRIPYPKLTSTSRRFAISPDHAYVYDFCDCKARYDLIVIDIHNRKLEKRYFKNGIGSIDDMICTQDGALYLLEGNFNEGGVRCLSATSSEINKTCNYKYKWNKADRIKPFVFWNSPEKIITEKYTLFTPETGNNESFLKGEQDSLGLTPQKYRLDTTGRYIIFRTYPYTNIVVDLVTREIVSRYCSPLFGCIVDNEFWISSEEGVQRKPFPFFEELPKERLSVMIKSTCDDYV